MMARVSIYTMPKRPQIRVIRKRNQTANAAENASSPFLELCLDGQCLCGNLVKSRLPAESQQGSKVGCAPNSAGLRGLRYTRVFS